MIEHDRSGNLLTRQNTKKSVFHVFFSCILTAPFSNLIFSKILIIPRVPENGNGSHHDWSQQRHNWGNEDSLKEEDNFMLLFWFCSLLLLFVGFSISVCTQWAHISSSTWRAVLYGAAALSRLYWNGGYRRFIYSTDTTLSFEYMYIRPPTGRRLND